MASSTSADATPDNSVLSIQSVTAKAGAAAAMAKWSSVPRIERFRFMV